MARSGYLPDLGMFFESGRVAVVEAAAIDVAVRDHQAPHLAETVGHAAFEGWRWRRCGGAVAADSSRLGEY